MVTAQAGKRQPLGQGIHAVLFALFGEHGELDLPAMKSQIDDMIASGCAGVTLLGLATEVHKLTHDEQASLIRLSGAHIAKRVDFSVTISGATAAEQKVKAAEAQLSGADWIILQPPKDASPTPRELEDFFAEIAHSTRLPVAIQNAPAFLPHWLTDEGLSHLARRSPNVFAVKAEDSVLGLEQMIRALPDLLVLGGRGGLEMTDALRAGCQGFVLAPDIAPAAVQIFKLWNSGDQEAAERLYASVLPAIVFVMQSLDHLITYGKRIYGANAGHMIHDRPPFLPITAFGISAVARYAQLLSTPSRQAKTQQNN